MHNELHINQDNRSIFIFKSQFPLIDDMRFTKWGEVYIYDYFDLKFFFMLQSDYEYTIFIFANRQWKD